MEIREKVMAKCVPWAGAEIRLYRLLYGGYTVEDWVDGEYASGMRFKTLREAWEKYLIVKVGANATAV